MSYQYGKNIIGSLFEQLCYDNMAKKWGQRQFLQLHALCYRSLASPNRSLERRLVCQLDWSIIFGIRAGLIGFSQWGSDTGG